MPFGLGSFNFLYSLSQHHMEKKIFTLQAFLNLIATLREILLSASGDSNRIGLSEMKSVKNIFDSH